VALVSHVVLLSYVLMLLPNTLNMYMCLWALA